jgi:hypothetical protein
MVQNEYGIEIDLRDHGDRLILQHDPFMDGEDADTLFEKYQHKTLILNVKSERIEARVLELIKKHNIVDFFFLDSSIPMIVSLANTGETRMAVRFSEYETIETVLNFAGKVDWVWVDCFSKLSINLDQFTRLKNAGFRTCLVSPELQGRPDEIELYKKILAQESIKFDAICTKLANIPRWQA